MKASIFKLLGLVALAVAVLAGPVRADSWVPPETETTLSTNGQFRFTVEPAPVGDALRYYREEIAAAKSGTSVKRPAPLGLLERKGIHGRWEPVWAGPLANPVAPVTVLVADDGRHVVTFDDWAGLGYGSQAIAIYGPEGKLVRALALTDLMPQVVIDALPHSVSSIHWRQSESFAADGAGIVVTLPVPGQDWDVKSPATFGFVIALADGAVTTPPGTQWETVLAAAAKVAQTMQQAEAERVAYLTNPLAAPEGCAEQDWHAYLVEAHARLTSAPPFEVSTATTVLHPRDHPRYGESVAWLREEVTDVTDFPSDSAFVSPCDADGLVAAFAGAVKHVKPGTAAQSTFYIAAPQIQFAAITRLVAPTGAKTVWIDPAAPIAQRPDRIPGSPGEAAARKAWEEQLEAEAPAD